MMEKELPKGWEIIRLEDLPITFRRGVNAKEKGIEGEVYYIPSGANFPNGIKTEKIQKISLEVYNSFKEGAALCKGDVLFNSGGVGTLGRVGYFVGLDLQAVADSFILIIRTDTERIRSKYLYYWFQTHQAQKLIRENTKGTTGITSIKSSDIQTFIIPIAPIKEQQIIEAKLDSIFAHLEVAKQGLEKIPVMLKQFRQTVLTQAVTGKLTEGVGWNKIKLGQLVGKGGIFDGPFGSNLKSQDYTVDGVQVIRLENIDFLRFNHSKLTFISKEKHKTLVKHTVDQGDIIFSSFISENIRACILPKLEFEAIAKADCFCIRPDENKILKEYLIIFLVSRITYNMLVNHIHGATRPRINTGQLKVLEINVPPIQEQTEIVRRVEALFSKADAIEAQYIKLKGQINQLPQAILAKAFRGEV